MIRSRWYTDANFKPVLFITTIYLHHVYWIDYHTSIVFGTWNSLHLRLPTSLCIIATTQIILSWQNREIADIRSHKSQNLNFVIWSCSCLCPSHWSQVLNREWRCSWSCADAASNILLIHLYIVRYVWNNSQYTYCSLYSSTSNIRHLNGNRQWLNIGSTLFDARLARYYPWMATKARVKLDW